MRQNSASLLADLRRAMLPLDGSIAEHVPDIVRAFERIVPARHWPSLTLVDLTSGSCLLPLIFAARGTRHLVVNDTAERSRLAAAALFGRQTLDWQRVRAALSAPRPRLVAHVPSFHFACDYLLAGVAETFDRLYYARWPAASRAAYQYLAIRWVMGFTPSVEDVFTLLPTHDLHQLRADTTHDWRPYLARLRQRDRVLRRLVTEINDGIRHVRGARAELRHQDMLVASREIAYGRRTLAVVNPPTRGVDEYVIDDQLVHSLMVNRWLPLTRSRETPEAFWTRRVETALRRLPTGSHAIVWGGDGALRWRDCRRVWLRYGRVVASRRARDGDHVAGWAIVEKS